MSFSQGKEASKIRFSKKKRGNVYQHLKSSSWWKPMTLLVRQVSRLPGVKKTLSCAFGFRYRSLVLARTSKDLQVFFIPAL